MSSQKITDAQSKLARAFERAGITTISQAVKAFERNDTEQIEKWKKQLSLKSPKCQQMTDGQELAKAIQLAVMYFADDVSLKDGEPLILHSLRVMLAGKTPEEKIAGMLHDGPEDTIMRIQDLEAWGFRSSIVQAVDALTRRKDEVYGAYLKRVQAASPLAMAVKINDLTDNINRPPPINEDQETSNKRKSKYIIARADMEYALFHTKSINTIVTMGEVEAKKDGH